MTDERADEPDDAALKAKIIREHFATQSDGVLTDDELARLVATYDNEINRATLPADVKWALRSYDQNHDGRIDQAELASLKKDLSVGRSAGYAHVLGVMVRYLAFTSDLGEAVRPVVATRLVRSMYGISWGYCGGDVIYNTWMAHKAGVDRSRLQEMTVERILFHSVASMALPAFTIHTTVKLCTPVLRNRFAASAPLVARFGPSFCGLCMVPFLPFMFDHSVEGALAWGFANYGPWANSHKDHAGHKFKET